MPELQDFEGFSKETVTFFQSLKRNNNKKWFDSHKSEYNTFVLQPSRAFVVAMGERLKSLSPNILAIPKTNMSLFRIYRDTRFSPDKSPYKTYMGIYFWEGSRPRMECSGYYFHLEPPNLLLGTGIYMFPRNMFDRYRNSVVHPDSGKELTEILKEITDKKGFEIGGKHYKRIPPSFDPSHPNAEFLLHNGLYIGYETKIPEEFYSRKLIEYCLEKFHLMEPLHKWLTSITSREFIK